MSPPLHLRLSGIALLAALPVAAPAAAHTYALDQAGVFSPAQGHGFDFGTAPGAGPFYFSITVPEGNWRVTVECGGPAAGDTTIKAESRRLMAEGLRTAPGETVARSFLVNVRNADLPPPPPNAPGGDTVLLTEREAGSLTWDDKLTLEFGGPAPAVRTVAIEPAEVPTVFLLGDSTVTDQRHEDGAGWGQMLPRFFGPAVAVANHAESGETLKSFVTGLRFAKVLSQLKAGDWVFIQFGHNDQKQNWPQTYAEAGNTFRTWLHTYVAEIRLRGATPVLVTPPQRRTFDAHGRIRNTHGDYPAAVRAVAAEAAGALIDLETASRAFYEALGPERAPLAFADSGRDPTHHNNYGAYRLAQAVAQGIRDAGLPLAEHLFPDFAGYDPAAPEDPAAFNFAASPAHRRGN